jgi:hypothetical protein
MGIPPGKSLFERIIAWSMSRAEAPWGDKKWIKFFAGSWEIR